MNRFVKVAVSCAECGKQFGEANHRFVVTAVREPATVQPDQCLYSVRKFDPDTPPKGDREFPVCGESCLQTLAGKILSGKKL